MRQSATGIFRHLTLILATGLHMLTHAYGTVLVPLYLLMVADLHLSGVRSASLVVTIYGLVYCLGSFVAGALADGWDRKWLLGVGLIGNALAILAMGLTRNYPLILTMGVAAGLFGTLFHPAANALVPAHYPRAPGMAIGLLGAGSGLGFYLGPRYAGWRARPDGWHALGIANWQRPLIELGLIGLVVGVAWLLFAREPRLPRRRRTPNEGINASQDSIKAHRLILMSFALGCRDFAGIATLSLASIYLGKAYHMGVDRVGAILGLMMLSCVLVNPLSVWISPGKWRLPILAASLIGGGLTLATVPLWDVRGAILALCLFEACQMGSYALSDAAMMERTPSDLRGRVAGLFLTIAGTMGAASPFIVGWWTDSLGTRAANPQAYLWIFLTLAVAICLATLSIPLISGLGAPSVESPVDPLTEINPATLEPIG